MKPIRSGTYLPRTGKSFSRPAFNVTVSRVALSSGGSPSKPLWTDVRCPRARRLHQELGPLVVGDIERQSNQRPRKPGDAQPDRVGKAKLGTVIATEAHVEGLG